MIVQTRAREKQHLRRGPEPRLMRSFCWTSFVIGLTFLSEFGLPVQQLGAQQLDSQPAETQETGAQETGAQESDEGTVAFERLGAAAGMRQYRAGKWGIVGVNVSNTTDQSANVLASFGFDSDSTLRYARKFWVPPNSRRRTWAPIHIPQNPASQDYQDLYSQLIESDGQIEKVKSRAMEREQHVSRLRLVNESFVTGVITGLEDFQVGDEVDPRYESIIAARAAASMGRRIALIGGRYLPSTAEAYDALDELVLYNDRFAEEPVACAAIRSWLNDGGQIWLQLDRVQMTSAAKLLGERFRCEEVDRVELNTIEITPTSKRPGIRYTGEREFELPVPMVRVAVEDVEVTHEVGGWPAAFSMPFGRGKVIITTLGGYAWMTQPTNERDISTYGRFDATVELSELSVIESRVPTPATGDVFAAYLSERIGYEIVGRNTVIATLGAFCLFLFATGCWLVRIGKLERMAWIGPLSALLASVPMVWLGAKSKNSAPPTIAMGQFVEVGDSSSSAAVTGAMAIYQPEPATLTIGAQQGGVFEPDFKGIESSTRRMVWTDMDRWNWDRVRFTAGVRQAEIRRNLLLPSPVEARGSFDEGGFSGQMSGGLSFSDALLVTPGRPAQGVRFRGSDFKSGSADQMAAGQFVAGTILTDEQRRRQAVYDSLLSTQSQEFPFPNRRLLMGWTEPFDLNFSLPDEMRVIGGALVVTPLLIDPPTRGSRMTIPSSFVNLQTTAGPGGEFGGSPLYNSRTGAWIAAKTASKTWLLCRPPREVLPATIDQVIVRMKATIPSRTLTIAGFKGGQVVPLRERDNVIVPFELTIDDPDLLKLDSRGGIPLGVLISDENNPGEFSDGVRWSVDYLQVEIRATAE